ncbi:hypothetical protein IQ272_09955 [Chroococcidiopsidales cyanobacterium LEGE 13417]|nr:hypothetical protein [Chroococcidiopsidales cyanobacterium LEGE 13417]
MFLLLTPYSLLRGSDGERGSNAEGTSASARLETSPSARFPTPYSLTPQI